MRRLAAISLVLCFLSSGTGLLAHVHDRSHALQDSHRNDEEPAPVHSEQTCLTHFQLHLPVLSAGHVPLLVLLGLFVGFLTQLAPRLTPATLPLRLDCRGPPAC